MRKLHWFFALGLGLGTGGTLVHLAHSEFVQASPAPQVVENYNPQVSFAPLVEALSPAVVNIDVAVSVDLPEISFLAPFGYDSSTEHLQMGQGSGFLISADGYLLTNYHVIEGADELTVKLSNDEQYQGVVVGYDDSIDVALVKIKSEKELPYVKLGNSSEVKVGDWAVAIGNPFGLSHTVTSGIISAKGRTIGSGPYDDFLQTDASINPGNSGGPLFNLQGEVIGINTAINPRGQGIGFSVPIDKVNKILEDLKENGQPSRGWLGIGLSSLSLEQKKKLAVERGVLVGQVYTNSPAEKAGLQSGDIILQFGDHIVENTEEFIRVVGSYRAKENELIRILRNGQEQELSVTLGKRPTQKELSTGTFLEKSDTLWRDWGIRITKVRYERSEVGFIILEIAQNSPFKKDFNVGDIIVSINDQEFSSEAELSRFSQKNTSELEIEFYRNGKHQVKTLSL